MKISTQDKDIRATAPGGTFRGDGARFIGAGLVNTGLTFLVYQLLLWVVPPGTAYSLAWLVGLAFVVGFYPGRVFAGGGKSWRERSLMGASYVIVFAVGFFALEFLVETGMSSRFAILLVMVLTTAANFLFGRLISYGRSKNGR